VSSYVLAALLIFGLGHPAREPLDPAKSAPLHSRLKCDGYGSPEDLLRIQVTYSPGAWAREFVVSRFQTDKCGVETMFQCWHKPRAGWHELWSATNEQASSRAIVPINSCDAWGSTELAQYVLSGWYQEGAANAKLAWHQATIKQLSSLPEVYEFTDPNGGTARLEITR
jgi:hypothetical protein